MRIVGSVGAIFYGIAGAYAGIAQQRVGLPQEAIDCEYRVPLLRNRVVAAISRRPAQSMGTQVERQQTISTLLRETQAACAAKHPELASSIATLDAQHRAYLARRAHDAQARQELLAL